MGVITADMPAKNYFPNSSKSWRELKKEILERVTADIDEALPFFEDKCEERNINYEFYKGNQWTQEEIESHLEQYRKPYVFNEIQHKVDHLVGTQTQTRLDAKCMPREKGDEAQAELLTFLVKWAEQVNQLEYVETDIFTEALICGAGISLIRWEKEDVQYGYPKIEKVPLNEILWDTTSRKLDLSDARWMARHMVMTRMDASEMFPHHQEIVEKASMMSSYSNLGRYPSMFERYKKYGFGMNAVTKGRELINVIEHYERAKKYVYTVVDEIRQTVSEFDNRQDGEAYYDGIVDEYVKNGEVLINPDGSPRVALVIDSVDNIIQTIIIGDEVVEYNVTALTDFPFTICFGYFNDGDFWGFVNSLKDPQRLVNTFFSQMEYQLAGGHKNLTTVVPPLLWHDFTFQDYVRESARTNAVIPVKQQSAIEVRSNTPTNPEYFQYIMFGIQRMIDYAGGRNTLGFSENAAESGRAVIARAEQGGVSRLPLFDKLRHWRILQTLKLVWYIKNFMNANQILRIIGVDEDVAYINIDDQLLESLREIKVDIIIDEAVKSDTIRERNFQQMKELFSVMPGLPPEIVANIMLEYSGIPQSKKREIKEQLEFYRQYMQQKAEMQKQEKLTQEVKDSLVKRMLKEQMLASEKLEEAEVKLKKKQRRVKSKLDDVERMRIEREEENLGPTEVSAMADRAKTNEEIGGVIPSKIQSALMR